MTNGKGNQRFQNAPTSMQQSPSSQRRAASAKCAGARCVTGRYRRMGTGAKAAKLPGADAAFSGRARAGIGTFGRWRKEPKKGLPGNRKEREKKTQTTMESTRWPGARNWEDANAWPRRLIEYEKRGAQKKRCRGGRAAKGNWARECGGSVGRVI